MNFMPQSILNDEDDVEFQSVSHGLFIGGKWVDARSGRQIPVIDPSTEAVIAAVPDATLEDALAAVDAAAAAAARAGAKQRRASAPKSCGAASN